MRVFVPTPLPVRSRNLERITRNAIDETTYKGLCRIPGLDPRVSGPDLDRRILILGGDECFRVVDDPSILVVGIPNWSRTPSDALRALEVLAYGFHDYCARESVCGRGLFRTPP